LKFSRFLQLQKVIIRAHQDEFKEKAILAAFVGWQIGCLLGGNKTFGEYLSPLGLSGEDKGTKSGQRIPTSMVSDEELFSRMKIKVKKVKKEAE